MNYRSRINKLRKNLSFEGIDGFITFNYENIRYISGFTGSSAAVLITACDTFFLTDFRYKEQAEKEVKDFKITIYKNQKKTLLELLNSFNLKTVVFESDHLSYSIYEEIKKEIGNSSFIGKKNIIEDLRIIKDDNEIQLIKKAINIHIQALKDINPGVANHLKENEIAVELDYLLRKYGSETIPFTTIVASGWRSAMPHALPEKKIIKEKDFIVIDSGARYNGYSSDITRTYSKGSFEDKQKRVYDTVLSANKKAINSVKPGVASSFIDKTARDFIKKEGYGDYFGHGTGHGIGLEIHEDPSIRWDNETILKKGMVFTIEPGIYIPNYGGVRIEDMVVVTDYGCEVLTQSISKEFKYV